MQINQGERAVSTDNDRGWAFDKADLANSLAFMFDNLGGEDDTSGGNANMATDGASLPARAHILSGFRAVPDIGTTALFIDPGYMVIAAQAVGSPPDDSVYKVVHDPGTLALTMTANASGSSQLAVVECQIVDVVLETEAIVKYDTATGLFASVSVPKVIETRLTWRIRVFQQSTGMSTVVGWLPIMVAIVPSGATTWNDCPFIFDVRPLIEDKDHFNRMYRTVAPFIEKPCYSIDFGTTHLSGRVMIHGTNRGTRLGGDFAHDEVTPYLDLSSFELQPPGFALTVSRPYYLYLCEPYGLPRWCRYKSVAFGARYPGKLRGIPVLSVVPPSPVTNVSIAPIAATLGFVGNFGKGVCVFAGMADASSAFVTNGVGDGVAFSQKQDPILSARAPISSDQTQSAWLLTGDIDFPANARAVRVRIAIGFSGAIATGTAFQLIEYTGRDLTNYIGTLFAGAQFLTSAAPAYVLDAVVRVPLDTAYPDLTAGVQTRIRATYNGGAFSLSAPPTNAQLFVLGWEV